MKIETALSVNSLSFAYHKKNPVVEVQNFEILRGERVFLYGPSGSGKSTFLSLIAGVLIPQQGEIAVLGQNLLQMKQRQRDRFRGEKLGYVFQLFNLLPYLSARENIVLSARLCPLRLKGLQLSQELHRLAASLKIENLLDKKTSELSIGQQQRVALCRSMLGSPEMLIADEPTSALDEEVTEDFLQLMLNESQQKNMSVLFVSHDRRLAKFFDRQVSLPQLNMVSRKSQYET